MAPLRVFRPGWRTLRALAAALSLAGCADMPARPPEPGPARARDTTIELRGLPTKVQWRGALADPDAAWLVIAPGFTRRCRHLATTLAVLGDAPARVLCIDASMVGGNPDLADALAEWLVRETPGPARIVVAGHSAGAPFAARLGARLDALDASRLAGALLFDPVPTARFEADLARVSDGGRRPVLALLAPPNPCNARASALPVLQRVRQAAVDAGRAGAFDLTELPPGATHADVEGADTDWVAVAACGRPDPVQADALRARAQRWLRERLRVAGDAAAG